MIIHRRSSPWCSQDRTKKDWQEDMHKTLKQEQEAKAELEEIRQLLETAAPRTQKAKTKFLLQNLLLTGFVFAVCMTINAEGLRDLVPSLAVRVYRSPIPGTGILASYDGWNRLDFAHMFAVILVGFASRVWGWLYKHMADKGGSAIEREDQPLLFFTTLIIAISLVALEAVTFFLGLMLFGGGGWEGSSIVGCLVLTFIYTGLLLAIAKWHNDFKYGG